MEQLQIASESSRRLIIGYRPEESGRLTSAFVIAAQLTVLAFHGLFILALGLKLDDSISTPWFVVFLPVFVGDVLAEAVLACSWFASCTYIMSCMEENSSRVGDDDNPSVLTDILPEIVFSVGGFIFLLIVIAAEVFLYRWISFDFSVSFAPFAITSCLLFLMSALYGTIVQDDNSQAFFLFGVSGLASLVMVITSDNLTERLAPCLLLAPAIATFIMAILELLRLRIVSMVLVEEERNLRLVKSILFFCIGIACAIPIFQSRRLDVLQRCSYTGPAIAICVGMICFVGVKIRTTQKSFRNGTVRERLHQDFLLRMVECQHCVPGVPSMTCDVHNRQQQPDVSKEPGPQQEGDRAPLIGDWPPRGRIAPVVQPHAGDTDSTEELFPPPCRSKRS
eukprot:GHVS01004463.1.p2 GENE.GHVS01004463.1~~GHVS01004463.1.p2  ORF type:complete len:394 (+),score=29.70 GHVS01004463.1:130-1311(+)